MTRSSFGKRDRERAKKAKADAKRQRRESASTDSIEAVEPPGSAARSSSGDAPSAAELIRRIEEVHRRHDSNQISDDEFETTKATLLGQLPID